MTEKTMTKVTDPRTMPEARDDDVFILHTAGGINMGKGRPEFNDDYIAAQPHLERMIINVGRDILRQGDDKFDDDNSRVAELLQFIAVGGFNWSGYNFGQENRGSFGPTIHDKAGNVPTIGVEGACNTGMKTAYAAYVAVKAGEADIALAISGQEQNTFDAVGNGTHLSAASWIQGERADLGAFPFPELIGERVPAWVAKYGQKEDLRTAMNIAVAEAHMNAKKNPNAQKHHDTRTYDEMLRDAARISPGFNPYLSLEDCSQVTDNTYGCLLVSRKGVEMLREAGVEFEDSDLVRISSFGLNTNDIRNPKLGKTNLYELETTIHAVNRGYTKAEIDASRLRILQEHDCFSIADIMSAEASRLAEFGEGARFVLDGGLGPEAECLINTDGGLKRKGHPVAASGLGQIDTLYKQVTGKAGTYQIKFTNEQRGYGMAISMGGNDRDVGTIIVQHPLIHPVKF